MNGNTPYAGLPGVSGAGQRAAADRPDLSTGERRSLQQAVTQIADRTRALLPSEYTVDADVSEGTAGPQVVVAVRPPIGHPVSAGFAPDLEETPEELIDATDRDEVARGLAASAALQVKQAVGDGVQPTAK
ncbi:DUF5811 family protein [Halobacteria archaeon AArc-dxtr1]|nr:DUF5811 family protein [Halobacteria archaeon AArc-dxtr1]